MNGFSKQAFLQSRDPGIENNKINDHYQNMKTVVRLAEIEAKSSTLQIKPLTKEEFLKILKNYPRRKHKISMEMQWSIYFMHLRKL